MNPSEDGRDDTMSENPAGQPIVLRSILSGDHSRVLSVPPGTRSTRSGSPGGAGGAAGRTVLVSGG